VFGKLEGLSFSDINRRMPKITDAGKKSVYLDDETAHPCEWSNLIKQLDKLGDICLKPYPKSSSSDCLLFSRAKDKNDTVRVTVGLAVKNYKKAKFSDENLDDECRVFNQMYIDTDNSGRRNVLFICCTNYNKKISSWFQGKLFCSLTETLYPNLKEFANIHEVILLNLTTSENRAKFFNVDSNGVEYIVEKTEAELIEVV
jgi:hypothetical protein